MTGPMSRDRMRLLAALRDEARLPSSPGPPRVARRPEGSPPRLGLSQQGLWFLHGMDLGGAGHNVPGTLRLRGELDRAALERSLSELVRRHEALRTRYGCEPGGAPQAFVEAPPALRLGVVDVSDLPPADREAECGRLAVQAARAPWDLGRAPLLRAELIRLAGDDHVLCLCLHHIAADGWSMGILTRELQALYPAYRRGEPSPLPEPELQYADFVAWQRERLAGTALDEHLSFWRRELAGVRPLRTGDGRPRPAQPCFDGGHLPISAPRGLRDALERLAREEGALLYVPLAAAFSLVLRVLGGCDDVVLGCTLANRPRPELDDVVGHFAHTLPLRLRHAGCTSFRALVRGTRDAWLGVEAHQAVPFATLVRELRPEREPGANPWFEVVFDLLTPDHNPPQLGYGLAVPCGAPLAMGDLAADPFPVEGGTARFDVAVFLWDLPQGLVGSVEYRGAVLRAPAARRLAALVVEALGLAASSPDVPLAALVARLAESEGRMRSAEAESYRRGLGERLRRRRSGPGGVS